mmetsp:Transcript_18457/g.27354  ORF Transcript_18457/g.27354 Transcript_18457/m.27354 type:complete len:414 (-) Transcript_18457:108-1349(-)|eukprot:CAMPEP_0194210852 /NCGR_PEP_ID=MMETSP0156-20130528/9145_1 /TAXON_ID=33649 /ORGANISM="Thalassionema nitzschioides, Strain L26-B" /LENGTH=413 /DNA_ID=CAMNT_0038938261 /DNA_START=74 /DNA_END=1315 /DNA_ORIENTATION=-
MASLRHALLSKGISHAAVTKRTLSALVSATVEFPDLPEIFPEANKAGQTSVSTLSNGITVITEDSAASSTVSLTFPNAGSSSETVGEIGAALANKCLAFKSGSSLSGMVILRNMENDGASSFALGGRTSATVGFTSSPEKAARLIPLLATDCDYEKWDVRDALASAASEIDEASKNAQVTLTESLFGAAYGLQSSMGRPYYSPGATLGSIQSFRARAYGVNGAVLAATGVKDHASFCAIVEQGLSETAQGEASEGTATYLGGGEARAHVDSMGVAHVALAFKAPASAAVSNVLMECLSLNGASGTFSSGGLIGVYGSDVDAMCEALLQKPTADTITRAKGLVKAKSILTAETSSSYDLAMALTSQVLDGSSNEVSNADVADGYNAMLKSGLTMASVGNLNSVPYHGTVASRFG